MANISSYIKLMRLDKPIGIWLLFWPCIWGMLLASSTISITYIAMFLFGAILMRSAGCVINDIIDRDIDGKVARTKIRPIAAGEVSVRQAIMLTVLLVGLSGTLVYYIAPILIPYSAFALLLIVTYPFMKRITWWPQAFLGLTFNIGTIFGWVVMNGSITLPAILLYIAGICWTIGYDTIYAHQDIEDDVKIGVKSTAIRFGKYSKTIIAGFYTISVISLCAAVFLVIPSIDSAKYMILAAIHFLWQLRHLDLTDPSSCLKIFKSNQWLGALVSISLFFAQTQ